MYYSSYEEMYTGLYVQQLIDTNNTKVLVKAGIISADEQHEDLPFLLNSIQSFLSQRPPPTSTNNKALCKFCGATNVLVLEAQIRSADEGSNLLYECPECHKSWTT